MLAITASLIFCTFVPHFFSTGNLYALVQVFSALALVSTGLAIIMLAGQFDLSIVGTFPLAGLVVVGYADQFGLPTSFCLALVLGVVCGLVNGGVVGVLRIPSIAVTVSTMMLSIGLGYLASHDNFVSMRYSFQASLDITRPILKVLSWQSIIELVFVAIAVAALKWTRWGLYLYAIGSDSRKARASGLPVSQALAGGFVACAGSATLAGALQGVSLASSTPGANDDMLLQSATAALIGGVALSGGRGSLVGVAGGALLLSVVSNGLGIAGISSSAIQLVNGAILTGVVACDRPLARLVRRHTDTMREDDRHQQNLQPASNLQTPMESAKL